MCRPELRDVTIETLPRPVPYDLVRQKQYYSNDVDLKVLLQQENSAGDWENIVGKRIQAFTAVDATDKSRRLNVAESITFHPLAVKMERERKFNGWNQALFEEVTHEDAAKVFEEKGKARGVDNVVPADAVFQASFGRTVFHEVST